MQQPECGVAVLAADVNVLAEHGELLGEVTVELTDVVEALGRVDLLRAPVLERMRATAADRDVELARAVGELLSEVVQLGEQRAMRALDRSADLDHAARDLGLHVPRTSVLAQHA